MPLFLNHRALFVHIPKCGGDTFSQAMRQAGDAPFLFVPDGSVMTNGHTPQHLTWRELCQMGWSTPPDFRVVALVRHPVDRVLSAYRYIYLARPDLVHWAQSPTQFLDHFFSPDPQIRLRFDHHNLGLLPFLRNAEGGVEDSIEIWHVADMDELLATFGLPPVPENARRNVTPRGSKWSSADLDRVGREVAEDLVWFEAQFPNIAASELP